MKKINKAIFYLYNNQVINLIIKKTPMAIKRTEIIIIIVIPVSVNCAIHASHSVITRKRNKIPIAIIHNPTRIKIRLNFMLFFMIIHFLYNY